MTLRVPRIKYEGPSLGYIVPEGSYIVELTDWNWGYSKYRGSPYIRAKGKILEGPYKDKIMFYTYSIFQPKLPQNEAECKVWPPVKCEAKVKAQEFDGRLYNHIRHVKPC